jgi:hypothetical protein
VNFPLLVCVAQPGPKPGYASDHTGGQRANALQALAQREPQEALGMSSQAEHVGAGRLGRRSKGEGQTEGLCG